jgi:hypothetical protein
MVRFHFKMTDKAPSSSSPVSAIALALRASLLNSLVYLFISWFNVPTMLTAWSISMDMSMFKISCLVQIS